MLGVVVTAFVTRAVAEGCYGEAARVFRFALAASLGLGILAYAVLAVLAAGLLEIDPAHKNAMLLHGVGGLLTSVHGESQTALRLADRMQSYLAVQHRRAGQ